MKTKVIEVFCSPDDDAGRVLRDKLFRLPLRGVVLRVRDRRAPGTDEGMGLWVDGVPVPVPEDGDIDTDVLELACQSAS